MRIRSNAQIWAVSIFAGMVIFASAILVQWLVYVVWMGEQGLRFVGAGVAAVLMALLIQRQLSEQRKEREAARRRFELIAEMNHHIRNALQAISYERYSAPDEATSQRLKDAVDRIQWVLEEILPGVQKR
jgi:hypothetical protein